MKKLTLSLSLSLALTTIGLTGYANAFEGNADAGKSKATTCAACHGADGNSMMTTYPKIAGQHPEYIYSQLKAFKQAATSGGKEGRNDPMMGGMVMALSDQDMKDIAAYYGGQKMKAGTTPDEVVAAGRTLYVNGDAERKIPSCSGCHGPQGNGLGLAGFPKISFQHADYIKLSLEKFRSGERGNDKNGMMTDIANRLSDKDIAILSKYLGGLH